jgi:hypothetical protein
MFVYWIQFHGPGRAVPSQQACTGLVAKQKVTVILSPRSYVKKAVAGNSRLLMFEGAKKPERSDKS